jgi:co-chaperonin GroES (HSP10)
MECRSCGIEAEKGRLLSQIVAKYKIPFSCKDCGALDFKYQAIRDIVFIWPDPPTEKMGSIYVPDKWQKHDEYGVVISVGNGTLNKSKKYFVATQIKVGDYVLYDKDIPQQWSLDVIGFDGKFHTVKFMGEQDVKAVMTNDENTL